MDDDKAAEEIEKVTIEKVSDRESDGYTDENEIETNTDDNDDDDNDDDDDDDDDDDYDNDDGGGGGGDYCFQGMVD